MAAFSTMKGRDANELFPTTPNAAGAQTGSHRSPSSSSSTRSDKSRNTLVNSDAESEGKDRFMSGVAAKEKSTSCFGFREVFRHKKRQMMNTSTERPADTGNIKVSIDLHYVRLVHVLSTQRDDKKHFIPQEAKCLFDTGNFQGNIVSKKLVVDVLGYSSSAFQKLSEEEKAGGIGVTGHSLIPIGAINLTWYDSNGIQVFRDMRFLISENPLYDLIVGAHSIQESHILDKPNLAAIEKFDPHTNSQLTDLLNKKNADFEPLRAVQLAIKKLAGKTDSRSTTERDAHTAQLPDLQTKYDTAKNKYITALKKAEIANIVKVEKETKEEATDLRQEFSKTYKESIHELPEPPNGKAHKD